MVKSKAKTAAKKPAAKKPGPKPTTRSALDAAGTLAVCDLIVEGKSYREIASRFGVTLSALNRWMEANPERLRACARAREEASVAFDELAEEGIHQAADPFELAKAKEIAVHLRWRAKAVNPKRYGDRTTVAGDAENPLAVVNKAVELDEAALLAIAAQAAAKK